VNLAARLEAYTREAERSIVLDGAYGRADDVDLDRSRIDIPRRAGVGTHQRLGCLEEDARRAD
jgi:hypothetical protein